MELRCPHCQHALEIVETGGVQTVPCPSCGSQVHILPETKTLPAKLDGTLGRFQLLEEVGQGHYGVVWKARDTRLARTVALKLPRLMVNDNTVNIYLREAKAAAQLRHPNVVPVHEVDILEGQLFIVSDFIEGVSLADFLTYQRLPLQKSAELCATLADALQHAHQQGVIHRDLKPANVLLDLQEQPHLTDFGLAKNAGDTITITVAGQVLGTPAYMPPEQARGDGHLADARSDVYSLGVILYELLTGKRPFSGGSRMLVYQVQHDDPRPPSKISPSVPRDLETICLKAMAKEPDKRYATAAAMGDDLRRYLRGEPILARPVGRIERTWRWARRNQMVAGLISMVMALGLSLVGLSLYSVLAAPAGPPRYQVTIATQPPDATVVFMPRDPQTSEPDPARAITARGSPARAKLPAGDYFVVAYLPDDLEMFHEVYRHVPAAEETSANALKPKHWTRLGDGSIELPPIKLWRTSDVTRQMAYFAGSPSFIMGDTSLGGIAPPHERAVPPFWLDIHETSVDRWLAHSASLPPALRKLKPAGNLPVTRVSRDEAIAYAERAGKVLMDETQYEVAATNGGQTPLPWGDDTELIVDWEIGPLGEPAYDRNRFSPPVFGLYSGAAEWTVSRSAPYPKNRGSFASGDAFTVQGIVRGGPLGKERTEEDRKIWERGPRYRAGVLPVAMPSEVGLRCARSARPRLQAADFIRELP